MEEEGISKLQDLVGTALKNTVPAQRRRKGTKSHPLGN